uniref:C2H2-type domain-containing protein n=1 Tax=Poecilia formosa TaxID=48698 RepID=A0A096MCW4_POEFO
MESKTEQFACPHCTSMLSTYRNLTRHIRDVHYIEKTPMTCVDFVHGLYATPKHDHSPVFPIHVMKSTNPPTIDCELEQCRKFMQIAWSSGNPGKECVHLERTKHAKQYVKPAVLKSASLQDMLSKGLMSSEWAAKCENLDLAVKNINVDSVFPVIFGENKVPQRCIFTNETDSWCQFGRTRVVFDSVAGKWNCQCKGSGKSHRCIHRMMAMWWIYQESPNTVMMNKSTSGQMLETLSFFNDNRYHHQTVRKA